MPSPHKRTRSETNGVDENEDGNAAPSTSTLTATTTTAPIGADANTDAVTPAPARTRRQAQAQAQGQMTPPLTGPSQPRPNGLARASSLIFTPSSRRTNNSSHGATPFILTPTTPSSSSGSGFSGGGMLMRTQSSPTASGLGMMSPTSLKAMSTSAGGGSRGKGENPDEGYFGLGARRHGKGKENVPPKKDDGREDASGSNSRKRLRVSSRGTRGRSGSVSSLRSETPSSGRPSLGPSSSLSRIASRAPSPTPSTCSNTTRSFDSVSIATSSVDPLDVISVAGEDDTTPNDQDTDVDDDEMDIHQTPTKPKTRQAQYSKGLYTPPPSSPAIEVDAAAKRIELIRMQSSQSSASTSTAVSTDDETTKSSNPYKHLKSFLRLSTSSVDRVIVGREHEQATLKAYLGSQEREVGMYVSGPPGTGKTALVTALGRVMSQEQGWAVVEIGCMGLKVVDMWRRLGEELGCGKTETAVKDHVEGHSGDLLIILDEIDSLLPPSPASPPAATSHLLSKLFSLPLASSSTRSIKLVAISNTLDLTIRARLSLADNLTPQVLPFKAYGAAEMGDIMLSRIASASSGQMDEETVKVDTKAVELLTRKVEASNGDLRNCLGCLTSAVSLAEAEWTKKVTAAAAAASTTATPVPVLVKVSLPHTIKAFNSHTQQLKAAAGSGNLATTSATGKKVRSVPLQGKMVLVSILVYIARTRAGLPGIPTSSGSGSTSSTPSPHNTPTKSSEALNTANLFATYTTLLSHHTSPFPPSHESDYRDLLSNLEVLGLVRLTSSASSSKKYGPRVELCAREEEVKEGLGLSASAAGDVAKSNGMADDEVKRIYEREGVKIQAALKKAERAAINFNVLGQEA